MERGEGYTGIDLWSGQSDDDLKFVLLLATLALFALVYHVHFRLFVRMLKDVFYGKRQALFESSANNPAGREWFFRTFMIFQALFLCSICLFAMAKGVSYIYSAGNKETMIHIGLIFITLTGYYWAKKCFYYLFGLTFTGIGMLKIWQRHYSAIMGIWGVSLYLPVIWLVFVGSFSTVPIVLFVALYVLCRLVVIYRTIRIFHIKKNLFLYISLYLCGQEILPFFLLHKGIVYMYNYIEVGSLWH